MEQDAYARDRIAVVAGGYPQYSETFVSREVESMRRQGVSVYTVGLHPPEKPDSEQKTADFTVYNDGLGSTLRAALLEALHKPITTAMTMVRGLLDACAPAEKTPLRNRVRIPLQALAAIGLAGKLRGLGINYIHCHFAHAPTTIGMYASFQLGVPFGFTGHANDLFQRRVLLKKKLQRASVVAAISHWHASLYEQVSSESRDKVRIVRCGVDTSSWHADESRSGVSEVFRIITVARLIDKKGIDTLIRALPDAMSQSTHRLHLTIVGEGPKRDEWTEVARKLEVDALIEWAGALANDAVRERLMEADAFVLPCRPDQNGDRDGIPVVLIEAMAVGLPVVSGDLPAIRELVRQGETGVLIGADDEAGLASVIAQLASDPAQAHKLGVAGQRWVREEFELIRNVQRLMNAIGISTRLQS